MTHAANAGPDRPDPARDRPLQDDAEGDCRLSGAGSGGAEASFGHFAASGSGPRTGGGVRASDLSGSAASGPGGAGPEAPEVAAVQLRIRVVFGPGERLGPGKADLLERIGQTGSISAAGRAMGMSYKRAWNLVEELNAMFAAPLVVASRGGAQGGGAALTRTGEKVLAHYRAIEAAAAGDGSGAIAALMAMRRGRDMNSGK